MKAALVEYFSAGFERAISQASLLYPKVYVTKFDVYKVVKGGSWLMTRRMSHGISSCFSLLLRYRCYVLKTCTVSSSLISLFLVNRFLIFSNIFGNCKYSLFNFSKV